MSQKAQILEHLKNHEPITPLLALNKFGCFRLAARVSELRQAGHDIRTKMTKINGKPIAIYWMEIER